LTHQEFLLDDQPRFVDFDLFGMLENFSTPATTNCPRATNKSRNGIAA